MTIHQRGTAFVPFAEGFVAMKQDPLFPARRSQKRSNVYLQGTLSANGVVQPTVIRNISIFGALVECLDLPARDCAVTLEHANLKLEGLVLWSRGRRVGLRFSPTLSKELVKAAVGPSLRMTAPSRLEGQRFAPDGLDPE